MKMKPINLNKYTNEEKKKAKVCITIDGEVIENIKAEHFKSTPNRSIVNKYPSLKIGQRFSKKDGTIELKWVYVISLGATLKEAVKNIWR